ncbi:MAG: AMP-binding protein, partial [Acidobacteria bacterium]|nr:AMP-binding protein [Acidobacteriota bacterium]
MTEPRTLPRLLETSADRFPGNPLLWEKKTDVYEPMTYARTRERVHAFGAGLMSLGLNKGDRVALISEGRNDWVVSEMGILYCGAI